MTGGGSRALVATFSIVGFDPDTESLGVAVQSKFLAVGAVVPWARAGVGAVATQAMANLTYGPRGLDLMAEGRTASSAVERLVSADEDREQRQVGAVDREGRAATFTGGECFEWAGGVAGENFAAQGNILVGPETVGAMARTFAEQEGDLAGRLLAALAAGQEAGGDSRGKQSAALLVVREGAGYGGDNDRFLDLRVDDHPEPIGELARLRGLHELYFGETRAEAVVGIEGPTESEIREALGRLGYLERNAADREAVLAALSAFIRTENFEEREQEHGYADRAVLDFLRERAGR